MPGFTDSERIAIYSQLRSYESDFDKAQGQLRTIASAWSAAVLAAIALITINSMTPIVVPHGALVHPEAVVPERPVTFFFLRQFICFIGSVGVFMFWLVDQRVYQRLLNTVFAYGLYVELKNPDLPQVRSSLFAANLDVTRCMGMFYPLQLWAFWLLAVLFLWLSYAEIEVTGRAAALLFAHLLLCAAVQYVAHFKWPSLTDIVRKLYPDLAGAWPNLADAADQRTIAWMTRVRARPAEAAVDAAAMPQPT
jgi:hypothetical protein